jgi:hypothetical protein
MGIREDGEGAGGGAISCAGEAGFEEGGGVRSAERGKHAMGIREHGKGAGGGASSCAGEASFGDCGEVQLAGFRKRLLESLFLEPILSCCCMPLVACSAAACPGSC